MIKKFIKNFIEKKGSYLEPIFNQTEINQENVFINVGSGSFYKSGWISLDAETKNFSDRHKEAILNDAFVPFEIGNKKQLPFKDSSVDIIYCSHVLEHLKASDMEFLISDFNRCLKKNGLLRIAVPDADLAFRALHYRDKNYFKWNKRKRDDVVEQDIDYFVDLICSAKSIFYNDTFFNIQEKLKFREDVSMMFANNVSKNEIFDYLIDSSSDDKFDFTGHINWFNYEKLKSILISKSFSDVWKSSRNASISSEMQNRKYFDRTHPQFSLYVEAIK